MSKITLHILYPTFIESIVVYFLLRHRKKHYDCAFRRIKLTKGQYAIVDPEDYQKLAEEDWHYIESNSKNSYAVRIEGGKIIYMHRQIMNAPKGKIVDHRDHEGLNNTKQNLRFATPSQNCCNKTLLKKGTSKFRGVSFYKKTGKWQAAICCNGIDKHLGLFDNEADAAKAYDEAAKIYHGEFAVLNFEQVAAKPLAKTDGEFAVLNFPQQSPDRNGGENSKTKLHILDDKILCYIISLLLYIFAIKQAPLETGRQEQSSGISGTVSLTGQAETDMIKIKELRKRFGPIVAVDGVSFEVEKGQVLGFLGPNGAGKSTVMRMLACFLRPDSGTAQICGFDILKNPIQVRQNIGYLAENVPAYNEMTVGAFLDFICDARGLDSKKRKESLDKIVSMCHIESVFHQTIETLSKGYKRRVGLAQALIHDPPVLILDEPTDGLDPNQKHEVRQLISKMAKDKCIVVSTHILEEVEAVCSRAIIIARGKILVDSTPQGLKTEYNCTLDEVFRKITTSKVA
jgi:ABC-2 type transport system ATP-binding protein